MARHRWVVNATITESMDVNDEFYRRFTATIDGYRNWKIAEGYLSIRGANAPKDAIIIKPDDVADRVKEIRDRIEEGDEDVFTDPKYKKPIGVKVMSRAIIEQYGVKGLNDGFKVGTRAKATKGRYPFISAVELSRYIPIEIMESYYKWGHSAKQFSETSILKNANLENANQRMIFLMKWQRIKLEILQEALEDVDQSTFPPEVIDKIKRQRRKLLPYVKKMVNKTKFFENFYRRGIIKTWDIWWKTWDAVDGTFYENWFIHALDRIV